MSGLFSFFRPAPPPALRAATAEDAPALAALHAASFHLPWDTAEFERLLADRLSRGVVATDGPRGEPVGFLLARGVWPETEILSIAVAPRRRGHGIGRQLIDHAFGRLAAEGFTTVFLEVEDGNIAARTLYERTGFREIGRREGYYRTASGVPAAAIAMRRDIA
ncbi:ribosomal protein S18-alanine N-acetyltransferase [Ancylobacter lacus]|uniref:ribosomal protein S18-alanine N-acetyltransferase n=1 Tax=Ancylobacter lacus TaxID=2579970 RepID=UPI001BCD6F98|nr:ribosomal protein S18-alanine N-acetyltransferase [Ancylobacter lacus]MBS7539680.1 ribosomal protein S18-alanine N-acetyltransferase [Ancylobacter lacus]